VIALTHPTDLAAQVGGIRFLVAEFMYRPRPAESRARAVFDYAWRSRLAQLDARDCVLLLCDSPVTLESLQPVLADYPQLRVAWAVVNPLPVADSIPPDLPHRLGWTLPDAWQRVSMTDRWARIRWALAAGEAVRSSQFTVHSYGLAGTRYQVSGISQRSAVSGQRSAKSQEPLAISYQLSAVSGQLSAVSDQPLAKSHQPSAILIMPAHDAVWGVGLLAYLVRVMGAGVAVSPVTYHQHSAVPGVATDPALIDLLNAAFGRDALLPWKLWRGQMQGFWGKMSLLRLEVCGLLLGQVQPCAFEDDLAIDSALNAMGTPARGVYIHDPRRYRQALPVFERADARQVIERTLHYSLNIPGEAGAGSSLAQPLGPLGRLRGLHPRQRRADQAAEALVAECLTAIRERLARYGLSWVDWGAYRYVVRVGDPCVEVWKREKLLL
jgi:hypothetical protein